MNTMNKWKALLAAMFVLVGLTACGEAETADPTEKDTLVAETEGVGETKAPASNSVISRTTVVLEATDATLFVNGANPYYDKENQIVAFAVDREISYDGELSCDIVAMGDADFLLLDGELVTDDYPVLCTENGYRGAAIKLNDTIAPGTYNFNVNFSYYNIAFTITVD